MNKYTFYVTHTVSKIVEVEAEDLAQAEWEVRNLGGRDSGASVKRVRINSSSFRKEKDKIKMLHIRRTK